MRGRDIFIACDVLTCGEEIHSELGSDTYGALIAQARAEGWSCGRRTHYCPEHRWCARTDKSPADRGML